MSNIPISLNELQILEHYQEMEKRFKRNTERPFFPSLDYFLDDKDNLSLLKTQVENMIHFVGLGSMPLVINVEKLQNAAACINLAEESSVNIAIDEDVLKRNRFDTIFVALAHELGHKVLIRSGLFFTGLMDIENEIYADLSTFYLGFGKFTLRGCNFTEEGIKHRYGYLTIETYAMAYVISEYMNGREPDTAALPDDIVALIKDAVSKCQCKWIKNMTNEEVVKSHYKKETSSSGTTTTILEIFNVILEKHASSSCEAMKALNQACLKQENGAPLDCRKNAIALAVYKDLNNSDSIINNHNLDNLLESLAFTITSSGYDINNLMTSLQHKCPHCGTIINNPSFKDANGKRVFHIRCKKCNTVFAVDNNLERLKNLIQEQINYKAEYNRLIGMEQMWKSMNWWKRMWYRG